MYRGDTVAVVVPAYNEVELIGTVIETMPSFVDRIYAVDDCSTDGTWAEINRYVEDDRSGTAPAAETAVESPQTDDVDTTATDGGAGSRPDLVPIRHHDNRGVGDAILTGYEQALADGIDITAVMAGDGQMDPDRLDSLLDPIVDGRVAYAKGNRLLGRDDRHEMSRWRRFGNLTLTFLTKVATGYWQMMDPQNGYTAISREALEQIDLERLYGRYGFANDILIALNTHGFRIADVAMPAVYGTEESDITYRSFIPNLSWLLCRGFAHRLHARYLVADFHPLVLLYALGGAGWLRSLAQLGTAIRQRVRSDTDSDSQSTVSSATLLWFLSTLSFLLAMTIDRLENNDQVIQLR